MKIAFLGTRGIPNNYGGFEQFAEYISQGLVKRGHSVTVYNPHFHTYDKDIFNGIEIRKIWSPEKQCGPMANFIYDFLSLKDALKQDFDIIYECGYHSNALSYYILTKDSPVIITKMDGIEWKRSKWNKGTQNLIKFLEKIAVKKSDYIISDNLGIQEYYRDTFNADSFFIPYGADLVNQFNENYLTDFNVKRNEYFMLIARFEPENNLEMVLDGYVKSGNKRPFLVVGNEKAKYGQYLVKKYAGKNIIFTGPVYNIEILNSLRANARYYFHGHSVGGTNPSLLEAMASNALIVSHKNIFNGSVLENNAIYFSNSDEVCNVINSDVYKSEQRDIFIANNREKITNLYNWDLIITQHEQLFEKLCKEKKAERSHNGIQITESIPVKI